MGRMSDADREAFLAVNRYGILSTLRSDGSPIAIPVWFDWDGSSVKMFTNAGSPKLRRLANDARASVLVTNHIDEKEKWVAFDGTVAVSDEGDGVRMAAAGDGAGRSALLCRLTGKGTM